MAAPEAVVDSLYSDFFERGLRYFLPGCRLELTGPAPIKRPTLDLQARPEGTLEVDWFGQRYLLRAAQHTFTEDQIRLVGAIASVLSARYRSIFNAASAATTLQMFRGLPEDRFVSAFLDPHPYLDETALPATDDYVAEAIAVLRESSLLTYENRRITTGVLLVGSDADPRLADGNAVKYTASLTSIKSFQRLCDGLQTVFLVNGAGFLMDVVDIRDWASAAVESGLPAPTSRAYRPHCVATLLGGHICMALTPNGEIKIFAAGAQVFSFLGGRWRLTDIVEKYNAWRHAVGDSTLAERMFAAAMNLAEDRRGGLFVVLDDPQFTRHFVSAADLLEQPCSSPDSPEGVSPEGVAKNRIHYLLRHKRVLDLAPSLLETIARMDGSIVLDRDSNLLAFGAILRNGNAGACDEQLLEGGRTTAAVNASHFATVLKISEDGIVSFYRTGRLVWEI
ncbi:MAG: hypothetical protein ACR2I2_08485 [Bryobacteraceae bacterium]